MMLSMGLSSVLWAVGAHAAEDDHSADALERRQNIELKHFFANPSGDAGLKGTAFSIQLYNEAVQHFTNQDYKQARLALAESLRHDQTNPLAYELLGDIEYLEQNNAAAKENYQIAYSFSQSDALRKKIEKVAKETKFEQKLSTYTEEHFIIKYHDSGKTVDGYELKEMLREAYKMISQDLSYYFHHQVVVLLYDEKDFRKITDTPHWVAGLYDGKVRMPINKKGFSNTELKALARHELTHAFISTISKGRAPAWINEGLAEYEEAKVISGKRSIFQMALKQKQIIPLDRLMNESTVESITDSLQLALFYEQSHDLVDYLVGRYGMFYVKQMLEFYGKGLSSRDVIEGVFKISLSKLEQEWLDRRLGK